MTKHQQTQQLLALCLDLEAHLRQYRQALWWLTAGKSIPLSLAQRQQAVHRIQTHGQIIAGLTAIIESIIQEI